MYILYINTLINSKIKIFLEHLEITSIIFSKYSLYQSTYFHGNLNQCIFYQMNKIDELSIGRLQQTHKLQPSKPKDRTEIVVKIVSPGIFGTYQN